MAATYLVLFSTGTNDPAMAYVLGLVAVVEALLLWVVGLSCARSFHPVAVACARPLGHWAIVMSALAVVLCAHSPLTLALVAVSLLLATKGLPRTQWLYGAVAALAVAAYWKWLEHLAPVPLVATTLFVAFALWSLAVLVQTRKPAICRRLGLVSLPYERPLFHSAILSGAIAFVLRLNLSLIAGESWTAHLWLPLGLSLLSILIVRAYPSRVCVDIGLLFLTWSMVALFAPSLDSPCLITLAGTVAAVSLAAARADVPPNRAGALVRAWASTEVEFSAVLRGWAWALTGLSATLAMVVLADQTAAALIEQQSAMLVVTSLDWYAMLAALALFGAFAVAAARDPDGAGPFEYTDLVIAFHWVLIFVIWWLGASASPIMAHGLTTALYFPLATGMFALATAQFAARFTPPDGWNELAWLPDLRSDRLTRLFAIQSSVLAILAVLFTRGETSSVTVASALLAALALGTVALSTGWVSAAYFGSLTFELACAVLGLLLAWRLDRTSPGSHAILAAAGILVAAFALWKLSGVLRNDGSTSKRRFARLSWASDIIPIRLALAVERAALATALLAAIAVLAAAPRADLLFDWEKAAGVAVLMAVAVFSVLLLPRWRREWLVYLAQALILAAYVDFRMCYRWPIAADAAVLTLLGYIDLGLAELLDRRNQVIFARPARFTSLVLPVLPLLQLAWKGGANDVWLFHLLTAATFYTVACAQLRWKSPGYAAAVFYNAALWVLWTMFGWKLSDHFQFFMVPVGFSTILFAEAHRGELGRSTVNSIRSAGLVDHLRIARRSDLAVRKLWCLAGALARLARRRLPRHRTPASNLPLVRSRHIRARRHLRDGPR